MTGSSFTTGNERPGDSIFLNVYVAEMVPVLEKDFPVY